MTDQRRYNDIEVLHTFNFKSQPLQVLASKEANAAILYHANTQNKKGSYPEDVHWKLQNRSGGVILGSATYKQGISWVRSKIKQQN